MTAPVNVIELIKDRLDISTALSSYAGADFSKVSLNREKVNIKCCWHHDNSPSMRVFLADNRFHCLAGCNDGKHGDVIDVVRISYNLSTADAIKQLRTDLMIDSGRLDQDTVSRITEKRQAIEQIRLDRKALKWTTDALQWLCWQIPEQSKSIKTDDELEAWAPLIHVHAEVEYRLDCMLGLEYVEESDKAEIITWTQQLMEGVRRHGIGQSGETTICKAG